MRTSHVRLQHAVFSFLMGACSKTWCVLFYVSNVKRIKKLGKTHCFELTSSVLRKPKNLQEYFELSLVGPSSWLADKEMYPEDCPGWSQQGAEKGHQPQMRKQRMPRERNSVGVKKKSSKSMYIKLLEHYHRNVVQFLRNNVPKSSLGGREKEKRLIETAATSHRISCSAPPARPCSPRAFKHRKEHHNSWGAEEKS